MRLIVCAMGLACVGMALTTGPAMAVEVIPAGEADGFIAESSTTQAGAHADLLSSFRITPAATLQEWTTTRGTPLKTAFVDLPAGLVGNPEAVPKCTTPQLNAGDSNTFCPAASQVGVVQVWSRFTVIPGVDITSHFSTVGLYAMKTSPGELADFGFKVSSAAVHLTASVRPSDYGVRLTARNISQLIPLWGTTVTVWGVPADPVHDGQRCALLNPASDLCDETFDPLSIPHASGIPPLPFVTNPTVCDQPKVTTIAVESWQEPGQFHSTSASSPTPTGCDKLAFVPALGVRLQSTAPDTPTGVSVSLSFAQPENPEGLGTAHLRNVTVALPEGLTINPAAAGGLEACSDAQLGAGSDSAVECPPASKVGEVTVRTPVLADPLEGSVYVGSQKSQDPESGELFRLFMVVRGPGGLVVKLVGHVSANAQTGRLVTTFADNPQLPVSSVELHLKEGSRAALATPASCGPKTISGEFQSWNGLMADRSDSVAIDCPGSTGFAPSFGAESRVPAGGRFSPFAVDIGRQDGEEELSGVSVELPTGLIARLKGVPLCEETLAAAGSCPAPTRVGTATVGAGSGSDPFSLAGSVSLAGPYKGAPYSLSVAVPAKAGPFDLGMVVVRQAIFVDPTDAHLTVVSDPLPTIVKGVPVRLRTVHVEVDRPGFTLNPTSCALKHVKASLLSSQGSVASRSVRFQLGDCEGLPLRPRLALRLTGTHQLSDGGHPGLRAVLTQKPGEANLKAVAVALPLSLALDPKNAKSDGLCSFEESRKPEPKCPRSSVVGEARAWTPVLNRPLSGPVFFAKNVRISKTGRQIRTLPTLVIPLRGEVSLNVVANSDVKNGKLVNTFKTVPDAPVSRFELSLKGGKKGILVVNGHACARSRVASVVIDGQNGKRVTSGTALKAPCPKVRKARHAVSGRTDG